MDNDPQQNIKLILEKKRNNGNYMFKIKLIDSQLQLFINNSNITNINKYIIYSLNLVKIDNIDNIDSIYDSIDNQKIDGKLVINFIGMIDNNYPVVINLNLNNLIFDLNKDKEIIIYNNSELLFDPILERNIQEYLYNDGQNYTKLINCINNLSNNFSVKIDLFNISGEFYKGVINLKGTKFFFKNNEIHNVELSKLVIEIDNNVKKEIDLSEIPSIRYLFNLIISELVDASVLFFIHLYNNQNKLIQKDIFIPIVDVLKNTTHIEQQIYLVDFKEYIKALHMEEVDRIEEEIDSDLTAEEVRKATLEADNYRRKIAQLSQAKVETRKRISDALPNDNLDEDLDNTVTGIFDNIDNDRSTLAFQMKENDYINQCPQIVIEIYDRLQRYCSSKKKQHWLAAKYNEKMDRLFIIPSIIISTLSGVAAFFASTEIPNEQEQIWIGISVGILASITTLLQSFSNAYGFTAKMEAHQNSAEAYDQIITDLRFEIINPHENCNYSEFIKSIEKRISEIKQRCKYIIPDWIEQQYDDLKFNNINKAKQRAIYSELIEIKAKKYLELKKMETDITKIDLSKIGSELGI